MTLRHCWAWQWTSKLWWANMTGLKSPIFNRRYIFKRSIFCCHVSLPERNHLKTPLQLTVRHNTGHTKHRSPETSRAHKHGNCPGVSRNDCFHSKKIMFHWIRIIMICGRTRTLLFQHIPTFLPLHLQQPRNHHISILRSLGKRSPAFSMSPANVNSEARREQKRAPREEPGTKDWIVTIKMVRRVNRKNTSSRFETKR